MDPTACWRLIKEAIEDARWEEAAEHAENLLEWLRRNGFPPNITGNKLFDTVIARATATAVASWDVEEVPY